MTEKPKAKVKPVKYMAFCPDCKQSGVFTEDTPKECLEEMLCPRCDKRVPVWSEEEFAKKFGSPTTQVPWEELAKANAEKLASALRGGKEGVEK